MKEDSARVGFVVACVAVVLALSPSLSHAGDVFSDAKSWRMGFVDANGDGIMNIGKTEFLESLLTAAPDNAAIGGEEPEAEASDPDRNEPSRTRSSRLLRPAYSWSKSRISGCF